MDDAGIAQKLNLTLAAVAALVDSLDRFADIHDIYNNMEISDEARATFNAIHTKLDAFGGAFVTEDTCEAMNLSWTPQEG